MELRRRQLAEKGSLASVPSDGDDSLAAASDELRKREQQADGDAQANETGPTSGSSSPRQRRTSPADEARVAASRLRLAKRFLELDRPFTARKWLSRLIEEHPDTPAALEARNLLAGGL